MTLKVGELLRDRYRIEAVLAQGGMGAIYKATDLSLNLIVALKENLYSADEASRQFQSEARILANLRHSNLPRVTDHFVIREQGQYLVMDFITGKDLKEILVERGAISEEEAIDVGKAICLALAYLHSSNPPIVHRDIKPGNVKITEANEIILVDFGLAKQAALGEQTMTGAQALTPGFAPPEQYGQGTDSRSDIYSLGATLYAAVTVDSPPDGLTRAVTPTLSIDICAKNTTISPGLEDIIRRSMAVSPNERYQTALDMYQALCDLEKSSQQKTATHSQDVSQMNTTDPGDSTRLSSASQPLITYPEGQKEAPRQKASAPKWWLVGVLVIFFIGLGVGLLLLFGKKNQGPVLSSQVETATVPGLSLTATDEPIEDATPTEEILGEEGVPTVTEQPTFTIEPTAAEVLATSMPTNLPTPMGGGRGMIAFASDRVGGVPQIHLIDLQTREVSVITDISGGACQPDWSPDGTQIIFTSPCPKEQLDYKGSRLFIMNIDGSGLLPLNTIPGGDFEPAWNPVDANLIAFTSYRNDNRPHLYLYHLDDKSVEELSPVIAYDRAPVWSPDGKSLAFQTVYDGISQIYSLSLDDMKRREISKSTIECTSPAWSNDGSLIYYSEGGSLPGLTGRQVNNLSASEFSLAEPKPVWGLDFSPDDYWVAFTGLGDGMNRDIYVMLSNGGLLEALTNDLWFDFDVKWRP